MNKKFKIYKSRPDAEKANVLVSYPDFKFGENTDVIMTTGISTCLAITLYDLETKKGGLAHIYYAYNPLDCNPENIIDTLLTGLKQRGEISNRLESSISGAGRVTKMDILRFGIPQEIIKHKLRDYGIELIGEDLGAKVGRGVFLNCDSGLVEVHQIERGL